MTLSIGGVLRPQGRLLVTTEQVSEFARYPLVSEDKATVQVRMIATLAEALEHERKVNDRKATLFGCAGAAILVGALGVGGQGIVLGLRELGI